MCSPGRFVRAGAGRMNAGADNRRGPPPVLALAYARDGGRWVVPTARTLVLVHGSGGWVTDGGRFPDAIDVSEGLVRRISLPCVRLERGRLYVSAANGEAVYVPRSEEHTSALQSLAY